MVDLSRHPLLFICIALLSVPVYLGLALAIFGSRAKAHAALRYCMSAETWSLFKNPLLQDWNTDIRVLCFVVLCISFAAATCSLTIRYFL